MTDDRDLEGLDPYDLMDGGGRPSRPLLRRARRRRVVASVALRAGGRCATSSRISWRRSSTTPRASTARSATSSRRVGTKGATDLTSANELGIRELDDRSPQQLLEEWRTCERGDTRRGFERATEAISTRAWARTRRAGRRSISRSSSRCTPTTSACRLRASEAARRVPRGRRSFGRFALKELNKRSRDRCRERRHARPRRRARHRASRTAVFVEAVAARMGDDGPLDADARALLSATP